MVAFFLSASWPPWYKVMYYNIPPDMMTWLKDIFPEVIFLSCSVTATKKVLI